MPARDHAPPQQADLFLVPLLDGGSALGQVIAADVEGAVHLCLSDLRGPDPAAIPASRALATLYTEPRPFLTGQWQVIGYEALPAPARAAERPHRPEGTAVHDPAVIEAFLNAVHGLYPWDGFPDADFFTSLLLPGVPAPAARRLKGA